MKLHQTFTIFGLALVTPLASQIVVENSTAVASPGPKNTLTLPSFDASSASKLVVTVHSEVNGGQCTGVSFSGASLSEAVQAIDSSTGVQNVSLWYLDAPASSGDIVVTYSGSPNGIGAAAFALSGTGGGGPTAVSVNQGNSVSLTVMEDDLAVVAFVANGGAQPVAQSPLSDLPVGNGDIGSASAGAGYKSVTSSGNETYSFTGGGSRPVTIAAAFSTPKGVHSPTPVNQQNAVNFYNVNELTWKSPDDPDTSEILSILGYEVSIYSKPTDSVTGQDPDFSGVTPVSVGTATSYPISLDSEYTYFWRVDATVVRSSGTVVETGPAWSFSTPPESLELYVATDGDDTNSGAIDAPLATLAAARDHIRSAGLPPGGVTVWIRGGRYPITETFTLSPQDSGAPGAPIIYSGYPGETVLFDGSQMIPTDGFTLVNDTPTLNRLHPDGRGQVYSADVTDTDLQDIVKNPDAQLSLDDRMMHQSRFPNLGYDYIQSASTSGETINGDGTEANPLGGLITLRSNFQGDWQAELNRIKKARLQGYVSAVWLKELLRLHSVDNSDRIRLMDGTTYGLSNQTHRRPYFDNLLCEIDEPGEWYYDDLENKLYLWPYGNQINAQSILGVWAGPKMIDIAADHIRVENITLQSLRRGSSFIDIYGSYSVVAGCTMRYSTNAPYNVWNSARHSGFLSCDFYDNAGGGRLYGGSVSNDLIEAGNCFVENCHFTQVNSKGFYGKVIAFDGAGNRFRHNLMHNHNGQIVTMRGPDHLVEFNEIFNTGIEEGDGGSFYQGASFSSVNNLFRHNFWHHIMCIPGLLERAAIFSDDGDSFDRVEENVFYKAGTCFKMNKGAGHFAGGNVMLDSRMALNTLGTTNSSSTTMYNLNMDHLDNQNPVKDAHIYRGLSDFGIDGWQNTANSSNWNTQISQYWRNRYPVMDDLFDRWWNEKRMLKYSTYEDNVQFSNRYSISVGSQATITGTRNLSNLNNFVDPSVLNFKYAEPRPSWARDIPFENIGLYVDQYRTVVPDKNTYRKMVRDHWEGQPSEAEGLGGYNPDTIGDRIYFNTGQPIMNLVAPPPADATAVTITSSASSTTKSGGSSFELNNFSLAGGEKLVVTAVAEGNGGARTISSVTYNGNPLIEAVTMADSSASQQVSSIWFLDNPGASSGNIRVQWSGNTNGCGIGAYSLLGAASGSPAVTAANDGQSAALTTTVDHAVLIASYVANAGSAPTVSAPFDLLYGEDVGSAEGASASYSQQSAGSSTATFTGGSNRPATVAAAFYPSSSGSTIANQNTLIVSELNYSPYPPTPSEISAGFTEASDFEFIELTNVSGQTISLSGAHFAMGVDFVFPATATLASGESILIAKNQAALLFRYPSLTTAQIAGEFSSPSGLAAKEELSDEGERLVLVDAYDHIILDFTYSAELPWSPAATGQGYTLVFSGTTSSLDPSDPANWRSSISTGGNPMTSDRQAYSGSSGEELMTYTLAESPTAYPAETSGSEYCEVSYIINLAADDATVSVQVSTSLTGWVPGDSRFPIVSIENLGDGTARVTHRDTIPLSQQNRDFVRFKIEER